MTDSRYRLSLLLGVAGALLGLIAVSSLGETVAVAAITALGTLAAAYFGENISARRSQERAQAERVVDLIDSVEAFWSACDQHRKARAADEPAAERFIDGSRAIIESRLDEAVRLTIACRYLGPAWVRGDEIRNAMISVVRVFEEDRSVVRAMNLVAREAQALKDTALDRLSS